jgi:hypothetical protein
MDDFSAWQKTYSNLPRSKNTWDMTALPKSELTKTHFRKIIKNTQ